MDADDNEDISFHFIPEDLKKKFQTSPTLTNK